MYTARQPAPPRPRPLPHRTRIPRPILIAEPLRKLEALFKQGLIDEANYQARRRRLGASSSDSPWGWCVVIREGTTTCVMSPRGARRQVIRSRLNHDASKPSQRARGTEPRELHKRTGSTGECPLLCSSLPRTDPAPVEGSSALGVTELPGRLGRCCRRLPAPGPARPSGDAETGRVRRVLDFGGGCKCHGCSARSSGAFLAELEKDDFILSENGVLQRIRYFGH